MELETNVVALFQFRLCRLTQGAPFSAPGHLKAGFGDTEVHKACAAVGRVVGRVVVQMTFDPVGRLDILGDHEEIASPRRRPVVWRRSPFAGACPSTL